MKFEIIGNSHAALLTGAPPSGNKVSKEKEKPRGRGYTNKHPNLPFRTWFLGPVLAYNFYEHHLTKVYEFISEQPVIFKDKDTMILMCVGEIDCRVHLPKYVSKDRTPTQVVIECVLRYHRAITHLINDGYNVGVLGAIPSLSDESIKKMMPLKEQSYNLSGDTLLRNTIVKEWELVHSQLCKQNGIPYITIYENLIDKNGNTREELYADFIHLSHDKTIDYWLAAFKRENLL